MAAAPRKMKADFRLRMLRIVPSFVATLWVLGVAQFRGWPMGPIDYAALFALMLALQAIRRRARPNERPIDLGAIQNPNLIAAVVGAIALVFALLLGGLFEASVTLFKAFAMQGERVDAPWWLRTVWHGACAFASSYCGFLARIEAQRIRNAA